MPGPEADRPGRRFRHQPNGGSAKLSPVSRRLLVDGMNVIGTRPDGWWRDRPAAVRALVGRLAAWQATTGEAVTAVFDGRPPAHLPDTGVEAVFAPGRGRNRADDEIVRRVEVDADPGGLRVVTSDAALAARVRQWGAAVVSAGAFLRLIDEVAPA